MRPGEGEVLVSADDVSKTFHMEGETIQMQEIYRFVKESTDDAGNKTGTWQNRTWDESP